MSETEIANRLHYEALQIPPIGKDPLADEYATRYRNIRLEALKREPQAYSSTFKTESQWPLHRFVDRLRNPSLKTFIGLQIPEETKAVDSQHLVLQRPWQGTLSLFGPKVRGAEATAVSTPPWDLFGRPEASVQPPGHDVNQPLIYCISGVYVPALVRLKGVGGKLVQASLSTIKLDARSLGAPSALCIVMADVENEAAKALYLRNGFEIVGEERQEGCDGKEKRTVIFQQDIPTDESRMENTIFQ